MPLPQAIPDDPEEACNVSRKWLLDAAFTVSIFVLKRLIASDPRLKPLALVPYIISGHRSIAEQLDLDMMGRPAAPPHLSNHTSCPARAVDLRLEGRMDPENDLSARATWLAIGQLAESIGLRWGGGSPNAAWWRPQDAPRIQGTTARAYFPSDFNHFDMGPRSQFEA